MPGKHKDMTLEQIEVGVHYRAQAAISKTVPEFLYPVAEEAQTFASRMGVHGQSKITCGSGNRDSNWPCRVATAMGVDILSLQMARCDEFERQKTK